MRKILKDMRIDKNTPVEDIKFVIADVETTGLIPQKDRVCEIAMSVFKNFREVDRFVSLINPEVSIRPDVSKIHGITDDMVKNSPKFSDVLNPVLDILYDGVIVGHNIDFDYEFIRCEFERLGYTIPDIYRVDTLKISKRFCSNVPNNKLETIARSMNLFSNEWHRAENDVVMTTRIFENFLRTFIKENNVITLNDLLKITN
jgi:DNA polymerase III epsilon subunit family exonuclease